METRKVTEKEKEELLDVLTRAGLRSILDNFIKEKVFNLASCFQPVGLSPV